MMSPVGALEQGIRQFCMVIIWILLALFILIVVGKILSEKEKKKVVEEKSEDIGPIQPDYKQADHVHYSPGEVTDEEKQLAEDRGINYIVQGVFSLKGLFYRSDSAKNAAWDLDAGDDLTLQHEPDNLYDRNAIMVKTQSDEHIGYISADASKWLVKRLDRILVCKVFYCRKRSDLPSIRLFIRMMDDSGDINHYAIHTEIFRLHDYFQEATDLKVEGRLLEAADKFMCASRDKANSKKMTRCIKEACICYRKLGLYQKEKFVIEWILKNKHKEMTEKQYNDFFDRLDAVNRLIGKDDDND